MCFCDFLFYFLPFFLCSPVSCVHLLCVSLSLRPVWLPPPRVSPEPVHSRVHQCIPVSSPWYDSEFLVTFQHQGPTPLQFLRRESQASRSASGWASAPGHKLLVAPQSRSVPSPRPPCHLTNFICPLHQPPGQPPDCFFFQYVTVQAALKDCLVGTEFETETEVKDSKSNCC